MIVKFMPFQYRNLYMQKILLNRFRKRVVNESLHTEYVNLKLVILLL